MEKGKFVAPWGGAAACYWALGTKQQCQRNKNWQNWVILKGSVQWHRKTGPQKRAGGHTRVLWVAVRLGPDSVVKVAGVHPVDGDQRHRTDVDAVPQRGDSHALCELQDLGGERRGQLEGLDDKVGDAFDGACSEAENIWPDVHSGCRKHQTQFALAYYNAS